MPRTGRSMRGIGAIAAILLLAAACGNDEPSTEGAAGADPEEEAAEAAEDVDAAADWAPTEPVDYIAPAGTGGGWDTLARTTGRVLEGSDLVDQPFPVENREGGGGAVAWAHVAGRSGDDHVLFMASPPVILVPLSGEADHDHTDFTAIARLITDYIIYAVPAESDIESVQDLFDQAAGGGLAIAGGSAPGSMDHIALVGAAQAAGVDPREVNYIPFSGGGEAMTAALGGHVDAVVTGVGESSAQVEAGELRVLATSAPAGESPIDAPTLQDEGIDYTFDIWRGVMGPPDMSDEAIAFYEQMYADMLELDAWAQARDDLGWLDAYLGHEEFTDFLDEQAAETEALLDDLGLLGD